MVTQNFNIIHLSEVVNVAHFNFGSELFIRAFKLQKNANFSLKIKQHKCYDDKITLKLY